MSPCYFKNKQLHLLKNHNDVGTRNQCIVVYSMYMFIVRSFVDEIVFICVKVMLKRSYMKNVLDIFFKNFKPYFQKLPLCF